MSFAEIVLFHLRSNGDVYMAHWYVWFTVILFGLTIWASIRRPK